MPTRAYVSTLIALLSLAFAEPCFAQAAGAPEAKPPSSSAGFTVDACSASFEAAQRLQTEGKLVDAQAKLIECSQSACPAFLVRECVAHYDRLTVSIPTITPVARDESGTPLTEVTVSVDGKALADRIGGRAFPIDPGVHDFRFEYMGKVVTVRELLSEGQKNKPVVAEFVLHEPKPGAAPPTDPGPKAPPSEGRGVPTATYILGGFGIVAVGAGVALRVVAAGNYNDKLDSCSPNCSSGEVATLKTQYVLSTVGMGVGAAALVGAGLVWAFGSGGSEASTDQAGLTLVPTVSRHGAFAVLHGRL